MSETLERIIDAAGQQAAQLLCRAHGGHRLYLSDRPGSALVDCVGLDAAGAIVKEFGNCEMDIPMGHWSGPSARRRAVRRALQNGATTTDAARLAGVCDRTGWRVRAALKTGGPDTLPLFGDDSAD
ncbi:helix-turn-helix domain-containing protein [Algimonas porphyrae]|uniref:helix-turn-helix domain-containing protein n=1 Tax=Algimonas porphyrae TaxID=1128113 RepID=UPI0024E044EC|nr:helix-turn-helix domain-containing protein [Algimonas porphyrae]